MADVGRLATLVRQLQGRLGWGRVEAAFVQATGTIAAGATATVTVTHNLGIAGAYRVVAVMEQGTLAEGLSFCSESRTANACTFKVRNNGGANADGFVVCWPVIP